MDELNSLRDINLDDLDALGKFLLRFLEIYEYSVIETIFNLQKND